MNLPNRVLVQQSDISRGNLPDKVSVITAIVHRFCHEKTGRKILIYTVYAYVELIRAKQSDSELQQIFRGLANLAVLSLPILLGLAHVRAARIWFIFVRVSYELDLIASMERGS